VKIGGDISGLRTLGQTLSGAAPDVKNTSTYLCKTVDGLVHDAGWNGDAAGAFKGAWEQDGAAIDDLSEVLTLAGTTITQLADDLQSAQSELDGYVATAKKAGVGFDDNGPLPGPYTEPAYSAAKTFQTDSQNAFTAASTARQKATEGLHTILSSINPDVPDGGDGTGIADLSALGALLKGYYVVPNGRAEKIREDIADAKAKYSTEHAKWKNSKAGSDARKALAAELKDMRAARTELAADLKGAEALADKFKGGEFLDASVADTFRALGGELEADSKLGRALDGLPGIDVGLAALATWAQAKDDHEKGWSWTHALIADGGANAAALGAGIASDFIPVVGPFISPVISYGVGAFVTEATHEGHWTEHIHDDGVFMGTLEGVGDTGKAVWDNDVVGMGHRLADDAEHPVKAAEGLWDGVKSLF
jgi:uncharacterized protein YukE